MKYISTHEGSCCISCLEDIDYDRSTYMITNEDGDELCCCYELKRPIK